MKLSAPDAASLDRVSQALRTSGWQADLTGGSNAASGYEDTSSACRRHLETTA